MMIMALIHYTPTFDTEHAEQRPQSLVAGATRLRPITRSENLSGI